MKISVIGAGYVGLTTAACLAQIGHDVFCGEKDPEKLARLRSGKLPIFEPHLDTVIDAACKAGRLRFGSTEEAVEWGVAIFICVGTPPLPNGDADLHAIEAVASIIAKRATGYRLIVEKSTVPVQTGAQLRRHLGGHRTRSLDYDVASNPEFLREGTSVEDFLHPDRIVVGVESARAADMLREIYHPIIDQRIACPLHADCPPRKAPRFLVTDTNSSELIKHASNSFLAMKISFINMVSDLCEAAGADINKVAEGIGLDPRIGPSFLQPGIGFGGFCFPKDLQAFVRIAEKFGCDFTLLKEVERINQKRVDLMVEKIKTELWVLRGKKLCVLGLAFKPNTDDIRFAPALSIIRRLQTEGAQIQAYDPKAMDRAMQEIPDITYCQNVYEAAQNAAAVVLLTEWKEFQNLDWERLSGLVDRPLIIDGRNCLSRDVVASHGFEYVGLGGISAAAQIPAAVVNG
jgi:UDPglucose 6-dehydrogenase